ncbi:hypothetical protein HG536_0D04800 [Torulaspora globosa]|uniref:Uncharacterized protein n=1 Tax=Torulaspora globosa TaxID=48254 RepID=A0A7G3ZHH2_9SACH|nr:uncharacterized protein HG536_0D04800 [Torulaspora globosa]QLL32958.1 hypothetical protein HG536_0D04800 [Torulaspora globosa]
MAIETITTMTDNTKEPKDAFVQSLLEALLKISDRGSGNDKQKLIFKTLDALKLLCPEDLDGRLCREQIEGIDIFTPILSCDELKHKWDIVASYMAICSVHRQLQPLITGSITSWRDSLPSEEISPVNGDDSYKRGFYSIVSQLTEVDVLRPQTFEYLKLNLGPTLVASWTPLWLEWLGKRRPALSELDLLDDSKVDFYIATCGEEFVKQYVCKRKGGSWEYLVFKICLRMVRFPNWIPQSSYRLAVQRVAPAQSEFDGLTFAVQVVMEVVDHPELNFFETPHLALLLSEALKRMQKIPSHILHATLGSFSCVQSLSALINMTQYLLAKFLINTGETIRLINMKSQIDVKPDDGSWYKSKPSLFQIPHWFEKSIMPPIPPISKSSLIFQNSASEWEGGSCSMEAVTDLLLDSLSTVCLINERILEEYQELDIDPMQPDDAVKELPSGILHKLKQSYTELYLIPITTTLLLSCQLNTVENKLIGKAKAQTLSRLLYFHSVRICEELVRIHGAAGLFYLIDFAAKVSLEDLVLQRVWVEILNHIFFHSARSLAKRFFEDSALVERTLLDYVTLWNDGTEAFENFFVHLFNQAQPTIETICIELDDLIRLLPDGEKILAKSRPRAATGKAHVRQSNTLCETEVFMPSVTNTLQQNKYDPYSAAPFVPAKKCTRSLLMNAKSKAVACGFRAVNHDSSLPNESTSSQMLTPTSLHNNAEMRHAGVNDHLTANTSAEKFSFDLCSPNTRLDSTPRTPNLATSTLFNSPWNDSPDIHSTPSICKFVSTGKNYILGGHNRIRNNSRAQSIHIDSFDSENYGT